ncbi:uncharacterized protein LTR77_003234 [Saxophila tyrrhenica]|uniref:Uncharacterized protein n=1 Tax=Saxophila tyrrhenica TaxID=1690608 RepID=A0AAV9PHF1_9PEZI|nr:hypothetical protein LTR77_003234 [Saxophila tyrrhenica]
MHPQSEIPSNSPFGPHVPYTYTALAPDLGPLELRSSNTTRDPNVNPQVATRSADILCDLTPAALSEARKRHYDLILIHMPIITRIYQKFKNLIDAYLAVYLELRKDKTKLKQCHETLLPAQQFFNNEPDTDASVHTNMDSAIAMIRDGLKMAGGLKLIFDDWHEKLSEVKREQLHLKEVAEPRRRIVKRLLAGKIMENEALEETEQARA